MNDNTPMLPALRAAGDTRDARASRRPRRSRANRPAARRAVGWRIKIDPMMTIPLCCTVILALDALLG